MFIAIGDSQSKNKKSVAELCGAQDQATVDSNQLSTLDRNCRQNRSTQYKTTSTKPHNKPKKMNEAIVTTLPDNILEAIFSYLDLCDLRNCSLVCKNWYRYLNDENNDVWRMHCIRKLAEDAIKSDLLSSVPTYKAKLRAFFHAWNPNDCSRNVYIKPSGFTLHRYVHFFFSISVLNSSSFLL